MNTSHSIAQSTRGPTRRHRMRKGAAAVEAALLSPLLLIVALGAIDIGQYINVSQSVSNGSRVGTRMACRNGTNTTSEVQAAVRDYFESSFPQLSSAELDAALQVAVLDEQGNPVPAGDLSAIPSGQKIAVEVTFDFSAVRWMGSIDYWDLSMEPYTCYGRRE